MKKEVQLYDRVRQILESAKTTVARSVNTTQVVANWLVGREIVEEQQKGVHKAEYGDALLANLAAKLVADFGPGYSGTNLRWFRQFHFVYGDLLSEQICHAVRDKFTTDTQSNGSEIQHAVRDKFMSAIVHAARGELKDNPTLGLILCAEKNDAVVRYTLGKDQQKQIFASRYKLHLPTVAELKAEIRREIRLLRTPSASPRLRVRQSGVSP